MPKSNNHQSGSKKFKSKKLPVQGAWVEKSLIAEQLETLCVENEFLKKKNRALETKSETTPEDSIKKNVHIPKPEGEVDRTGGNAKKKGYHLCRSMGLSGKKASYHKVRTIEKFPWLSECEQTWLVLDMIKQYLQCKGYHECKKVGKLGKKDADEVSNTDEEGDSFDPHTHLEDVTGNEASDNEEGSESQGDAARDMFNKINVHETASSATQDKAHEDKEIDESDAAVDVNEDDLTQLDEIAHFDTIDEDPALCLWILVAISIMRTKNSWRLLITGQRRSTKFWMDRCLTNYDTCFNDGVYHHRNGIKQWKVGTISQPQPQLPAALNIKPLSAPRLFQSPPMSPMTLGRSKSNKEQAHASFINVLVPGSPLSSGPMSPLANSPHPLAAKNKPAAQPSTLKATAKKKIKEVPSELQHTTRGGNKHEREETQVGEILVSPGAKYADIHLTDNSASGQEGQEIRSCFAIGLLMGTINEFIKVHCRLCLIVQQKQIVQLIF
ncbi:hypothetical protein K439DRAFT_1622090 [Ramaria rubella]|nr:hypothetical protein K439DRAFT_1622090 [Ramaria rubella]